MLRHGRLKHKTNLGKQPRQPPAPPPPVQAVRHAGLSSGTTTSTSPQSFQPVMPPVPEPVVPEPTMPEPTETVLEPAIDIDPSLQLDPCFASLDPALYAPLPLSDVITPDIFVDHLSAFNIPNHQTLLAQNGLRDTLVRAVESMPSPPPIPSHTSLNQYVSLFLEKFLPHSPLLPPSIDTERANPLILTAMASIGALYSIETKTALLLHAVARKLEENLRATLRCDDYPIWAIQSLYLNTVHCLFDFALIIGIRGLLWICKGCTVRFNSHANPCHCVFKFVDIPNFQLARNIHRRLLPNTSPKTLEEWAELEELRRHDPFVIMLMTRTYFCIYLFSATITMVFASPPVVTTVDPRGLSLPCRSHEWNAKTPNSTVPHPSMKYDDAMATLWSGTSVPVSELGMRILATSVFLEIWQSQNGNDSWVSENRKEKYYVVLEAFHDQITALNVLPLRLNFH